MSRRKSRCFHADRDKIPVPEHPGQQLLVAAVVGRELAVAERAALIVDRGGPVGLSCWDPLFR